MELLRIEGEYSLYKESDGLCHITCGNQKSYLFGKEDMTMLKSLDAVLFKAVAEDILKQGPSVPKIY